MRDLAPLRAGAPLGCSLLFQFSSPQLIEAFYSGDKDTDEMTIDFGMFEKCICQTAGAIDGRVLKNASNESMEKKEEVHDGRPRASVWLNYLCFSSSSSTRLSSFSSCSFFCLPVLMW